MEILKKVFDRYVIPEPNSGCWLWLGPFFKTGYGRFSVKGRTYYTHRVALQLQGVNIPDHLEVDHKCNTRSCCNPDHLQLVTHSENLKLIKARRGELKSCRRGHDLTNPASYWLYSGIKYCKECRKMRMKG